MNNVELTTLVLGAGILSIATSLAAVSVIALIDKFTERWADD